VADAARAIGVNANTLLRWLEALEFRDAYRKARREAVGQSVARLQR
jgi:transposase-like protein